MLLFVDDREPGISRRKAGRGWCYRGPDGSRIVDRDEIDRLNRIGLPPAYERAWFCPDPAGHIQATGYDARGRKQYRYHPDYRAWKEGEKYDRCLSFGEALPRLRARVEKDLALPGLPREKVLAAVVRLLDDGRMRVGNECYAQQNRSFGATTLRNRHAKVNGAEVRFSFVGKSGKPHRISIADRRLAQVVRRCQDLPGQHLFSYSDQEGLIHRIGSSDVNAYLREQLGADHTAKHFRTWGASVIAFALLRQMPGKKVTLADLLDPVSAALGNTRPIARKSYVHPELVALATGGEIPRLPAPRATRYLSRAERGLLLFLKQTEPASPLNG